jgi:peptide/nickel transport system permease protein
MTKPDAQLDMTIGRQTIRRFIRTRFQINMRVFRRLTLIAGIVIVSAFYLVALCADFLAPIHYRAQSRREPMAPPTEFHWRDDDGTYRLSPFIRSRSLADPLTRRYVEDRRTAFAVEFWTHGYPYKFLGFWQTDRHLLGVRETDTAAPLIHLLGTDALGRDRFARLLISSRFSLIVAPLGTFAAVLLGTLVGCIAGYAGRQTDMLLMRTADAIISLPMLVLVLALRATQPLELPPWRAGVLLVLIFGLLGWAEIARLTRGLVLALREQEFVLAARGMGLSPTRILFRHILPNAARPLVVQATLLLPTLLLAETALSYFGAGLQEPEPSWGNMLAAAADVTLLTRHPLLLLSPAVAIFVFVLGVRFVSDGLHGAD